MADKAKGAKPAGAPPTGNGEDAREVNAEAGKAAGGGPHHFNSKVQAKLNVDAAHSDESVAILPQPISTYPL